MAANTRERSAQLMRVATRNQTLQSASPFCIYAPALTPQVYNTERCSNPSYSSATHRSSGLVKYCLSLAIALLCSPVTFPLNGHKYKSPQRDHDAISGCNSCGVAEGQGCGLNLVQKGLGYLNMVMVAWTLGYCDLV